MLVRIQPSEPVYPGVAQLVRALWPNEVVVAMKILLTFPVDVVGSSPSSGANFRKTPIMVLEWLAKPSVV